MGVRPRERRVRRGIRTSTLSAALLLASIGRVGAEPVVFEPARRLGDLAGLDNVGEVEPGLYRGGTPKTAGYGTLKSLGVRTVVSLRHYHHTAEERSCRAAGIDFIWLKLESSDPPDDSSVRRFLRLVTDTSLRPLYYHCWRGKDRTGTMTAAYRMAVKDWPLENALAEMDAYGFWRGWRDLRRFVEEFSGRRDEFRPPVRGKGDMR